MKGCESRFHDFGTGYSSLSYLRDLPIDILKVDKSFVSAVDGDEEQASKLVDGILSIARALGLQTIAEGIEAPDQAARLAASGCDIGQGYLWARPSASRPHRHSSPRWQPSRKANSPPESEARYPRGRSSRVLTACPTQ